MNRSRESSAEKSWVLQPASPRPKYWIELGRADCQVEGYQPRPFGCEVGSPFHQGHVSRGPPIIPDGRFSQVRFETLACLPWAFPAWRGLNAGSYTPRLPWFAHSLAPPHASAYGRFCARPPRCRWNRQVSRVPLPNVESLVIGETCLVSGEDVTPPSSLVRTHAPIPPGSPLLQP